MEVDFGVQGAPNKPKLVAWGLTGKSGNCAPEISKLRAGDFARYKNGF